MKKKKIIITLLGFCIVFLFIGCNTVRISDEEKQHILDIGSPLIILDYGTYLPNSAGGVDFHIEYQYISDLDAKYIYFTVTPYNAVDDIIYCDITRESRCRCKITGPIKKGKDYCHFSNVWYNYSARKVKINKIEIVYFDGTKTEITDPAVIDACIIK